MSLCRTGFLAGSAVFAALLGVAANAQVTVYNNFGEDHDGWNYNYELGWSVAGPDLTFPDQFGVEQAMGFKSPAAGYVCDIWLPVWYVPIDAGYDEVVIRLARNPDGLPPRPEDVMEEWVLTDFAPWDQWSPPIHLEATGDSYLEFRGDYWIWAVGGKTTWCGWCMNERWQLGCWHTLRIEGQDWSDIRQETAAAFRVDVMPDGEPCEGDLDGDGDTDLSDLAALLAAYGSVTGDPQYDPAADFDDDGDIDLADLAFLLADYGCAA